MISLSGLLLPLTEPLSKTSALIMFVRIRAIVTAGESTVTTAESQVGDGSSRDEDRDQARTPRETAEIKHSPLKIMNDVVVLGKEDILFR